MKILLVVLLLMTTGCSVNRAEFIPFTNDNLPAKDWLTPISISYDLDQSHRELGVVLAYGAWQSDFENLNELLQIKAREIGADALTKIHYSRSGLFTLNFILFTVGYKVTSAEAVAVKLLPDTREG